MMYLMTFVVLLVLVAAVTFFYVHDPCPACGSRLRANSAFDDNGKVADSVCGRCGHIWTPNWVKECRRRGE